MSHNQTSKSPGIIKHIRSFVLRQGHFSSAQQKAIEKNMPQWGIPYQQEPIKLDQIFQRSSEKILEIGFGMGDATAFIAQNNPEKDFLAVEVHGPGVGNLLQLIEQHALENIRIIRHDVVDVLTHMLEHESLDGIHIFFPDPWPKKRHHKRRLIQKKLLESLVSKLKSGGYMHFATDWEEYAYSMIDELHSVPSLNNPHNPFAPRPEHRPLTKFEKRGISLGHKVWDIIVYKNHV